MSAALTIIKAILGGIGGGFTGAVEGAQTADIESGKTNHLKEMNKRTYDAGNLGGDKMAENMGALMSMGQGGGIGSGASMGAAKSANTTSGMSGAGSAAASGAGSAAGSAAASGAGSAAGSAAASGASAAASAMSDIFLKEVYKDNIDDQIIENFSKISAIDFKYKPDAQKEYAGCCGVDNKEHIGVIAQELEANPATAGTVETNEKGDKQVNTAQLTMADTAAIAELSRRVLALEESVKNLNRRFYA
jgi:hypothetical protein